MDFTTFSDEELIEAYDEIREVIQELRDRANVTYEDLSLVDEYEALGKIIDERDARDLWS